MGDDGAHPEAVLDRAGIQSLIDAATTGIKESVLSHERRLEILDRRSRQRLVRLVHADSSVLPSKSDWLTGIRLLTVKMGILATEEEANTAILSLDLDLSSPKTNSYVVEVLPRFKSKFVSPSAAVRERLAQVNKELSRNNGQLLRYYDVLTVNDEKKRGKAKFYLGAYINHNKIEKKSIVIKLPSGRFDRIVVEKKEKGAKIKKMLTFAEVATAIGKTEEQMEEEYLADLREKEEKKSLRVEQNRKRRNEEEGGSRPPKGTKH